MSKTYIEKRSTLIKTPNTLTVSTSVKLNVPALDAWLMVGDFSGFNKFVPGLTHIEMTGEGVRSVRKKHFEDGNVVIEQLNTIDADEMIMSWSLIYTSLDIKNLWSSMRVQSDGNDSCVVIWDIAGEPLSEDTAQNDFNEFLSNFATASMDEVKNHFESIKSVSL